MVSAQQHAVQFPLCWLVWPYSYRDTSDGHTSHTVLLLHRSYANPGIRVIVWPLQHPAVLLTSVPAAMACTGLQFARPTCPPSPARLLSILLIHRLLSRAASPLVCRLAPPPCIVLLLSILLYIFRHTPKGSRTKCCIGSSSCVTKFIIPVVTFNCLSPYSGGSERAI